MDRIPAPVFRGRIENGRFVLHERDDFARLKQKLEGEDIEITLKRRRRARSQSQNAWYWGCVLPILAEYCGYDIEEMHLALKLKFLGTHRESPLPSVGSTADLDTKQFTDYIEKVRQLAAELGVNIPDPREEQ